MLKHTLLASIFTLTGISLAQAQTCEKNFKVSGIPLVTAVSYKSSQSFPKVKQAEALKRLAQAVAAEGFSGITVDKNLGAIDAHQETSGSGRPQTLRVVARSQGGGTLVNAVFNIQPGQVTTNEVVRSGICTIIRAAAG
ncbi:hypothetical protein J1C56_02990 [Aminobacter anthyllidis]|uniref:Uncharacterized protein n=1 Tax=Aminobacter anthyllidis TaxID=1035067 RepID=A0A9X1A743_9HYPH|nr:hypothetical protein [Aminobacter anthyllidis]MBT1154551.1 hypothetical protein [Aminobacter anthyllidis]MDH4984840.1 hypothetical protein [Aminobacter anthyllidis]